MSVTVVKGDTETLIKVMTHLNNVRERMATTDQMFDPLKQAIQLLHTYGQEMPEEIHDKLRVSNRFLVTKNLLCVFVLNPGDHFTKSRRPASGNENFSLEKFQFQITSKPFDLSISNLI